jgi:hypothetical protein
VSLVLAPLPDFISEHVSLTSLLVGSTAPTDAHCDGVNW